MLIKHAINTIMQSEMIGKILQNEAFIETILKAVTSSLEARDAISSRYEQMLKSVGLVTANQLEELQEMLNMLSQEAEGLREQLEASAETRRQLRERAEKAEAELATAQAEIQQLQAQLVQAQSSINQKVVETQESKATVTKAPSTDSQKSESASLWSPTMTKAELVKIATDLGLKVSSKLKKTDLIDRLKQMH